MGLLGSVRLLKPEQNSEKCLLAPGKRGAGGNWSQWRSLAPRISHVTWIKSCLPSGSRSPHLCNETGTSKGPHPDSDPGSQPSSPLPLPTSAPSPGLGSSARAWSHCPSTPSTPVVSQAASEGACGLIPRGASPPLSELSPTRGAGGSPSRCPAPSIGVAPRSDRRGSSHAPAGLEGPDLCLYILIKIFYDYEMF